MTPTPTGPVAGQPRSLTIPAGELRAQPAPAGPAGDEANRRGFTGIAVPWNDPIDLFGFREEFAPGSVAPIDNVLVCWRHDEPVGRLTGWRDADAGWEVDGVLSDTSLARDVATLLDDGVVDRLSIRFVPEEWTTTTDDDGVDHVTYTRARVSEVSLVPFPAYTNAAVSAVRAADANTVPTTTTKEPHNMSDTAAAIGDLRSDLDELKRQLAAVGPGTSTRAEAHPLTAFRSFGEYVKAVVRGDEVALRAYAGLVTGDLNLDNAPAWANAVVRIIEANTPTLTMFTHTKDLPTEGMTVDYGQLNLSNGLRVAEQLAEGDDLVFGKLGLNYAGNARVRTIGGWTDMSRQIIERAPVNIVDLMWRGFAIKYAEALEAIASAAMTDLYNTRLALGGSNVIDADLTTANGVIDLLVDLAARYQSSPYKLDGIWVAPDVFRALAKIDESPKALQITAAPTDKLGTLNVSALEAHLSNVPVRLWAGAPSGAAFAADAQAIRVQESPGAPFRLQDENIVNLTKQFSVYGYVAAYSELPESLVPIV